MSPRLTDWSLALTTAIAFITGIISLLSGHPQEWFIFVLHAIAGFWLFLLLWGKIRRVWSRVIHLTRWDRRTLFGVMAMLLVLLGLASGVWWVSGGDLFFAGFNLLNWHITLGFALTGVVIIHMFARMKRLRRRDLVGRRQAWRLGTFFISGLALWPLQQLTEQVFHLPGARDRFTGSREIGSYSGNTFPTSSWVADQPRPLSAQTWHLTFTGAIKQPRTFSYDELASIGDELEATLDCTGGFYSTQRWRGVRIGRLLDLVLPHPNARYVRFTSVTSYRWSLPLQEARTALLATHIGEELLSHDHGFPLRLVAPGHRGLEWVKWIARVDVLTEPDEGQFLSIFTSSFTDAGQGR